jgi:enoyl-CoA hydratase/carnithine racemase
MSDTVLIEVSDGVALLTLNRPDKLNALTQEMRRRYFDLLADCGERDDVRAIVVTGAGRGFCAGADLGELQTLQRGDYETAREDLRPQAFALTIPKPIVAAINGAAAGLGFVQALMCDVRFAAAGAKLTTAFSQRGLIAEHGISWMLPRLVGPARALDLLLSSRVVTAEEALAMGVVNFVYPASSLLDEAMAYARNLATTCSPSSMATMKQQVYADLERGLEAAVAEANKLMVESFGQPDFVEGVASFLERRAPAFRPLQR